MRKRMLQLPGVPEQINRETVPVMVNTTDVGFPDELKCLKWWKDQYYVNPWTRMIYGHFVLMKSDGSRLYGTSGCQCVETMKHNHPFKFGQEHFSQAVDYFKRSRALEAVENPNAEQKQGLKDIYAAIKLQAHLGRICGDDKRLLTGRFLADYGAQNWVTVLGQLMPPKKGQNEADPLGRRMRISAIRCLGEFVSDKTPFVGASASHLEALYKQAGVAQFDAIRAKIMKEKKVKHLRPQDIPLPPSMVRLAAHSLGKVVGENWKKDDPELATKASTWWLKHEGEERFQLGEAQLTSRGKTK
ncbi:MAG: hypothetical protein ACI97A_004349 [Planctomycetota bacterium]|jgi:hypothetical protein